jgi:hypothetical protein
LEQALAPFHDLTVEPLDETLKEIDAATTEQPAMIVLGDGTTLTQSQQSALAKWIDGGGVLVRFAGSSLSAADDVLIPTRLRQQDRLLGGALTWEKPLPLAEFLAPSPFTGLKIPDDVTITRQILAEPSIDLPGKTWASLKDGTPLVTAVSAQAGAGSAVATRSAAAPSARRSTAKEPAAGNPRSHWIVTERSPDRRKRSPAAEVRRAANPTQRTRSACRRPQTPRPDGREHGVRRFPGRFIP